MVRANKNFKIAEQPICLSRNSFNQLNLGKLSIEDQPSPIYEEVPGNLESDSGVSSVRFSSESPQWMSPNKASYSQVSLRTLSVSLLHRVNYLTLS